ncbi:MAG: hypothetical protein WBC44_18350 [Planctomycetaceae bacterium]
MTDPLADLLGKIVFLPLYLTTFIGIGLVLRLRRTHPRACWFTVAAGALMFLNWGLSAASQVDFDGYLSVAKGFGIGTGAAILLWNCIISALCTTAAALLIAAILTGRRSEP